MKNAVLFLGAALLAVTAAATAKPIKPVAGSPAAVAPPDPTSCVSDGRAIYVVDFKFVRPGAQPGEEDEAEPTSLVAECPHTRSSTAYRGNDKPDWRWVRFVFHETSKGRGILHVEYDLTIQKPGAGVGHRWGFFDAPVDLTAGQVEQYADHILDTHTAGGFLRVAIRFPKPGETSF